MRGYRKEWLKGEVAPIPSGMMEGKRNLSLLGLGWPAGSGDRRLWDLWEMGFFIDFGAPQYNTL